MTRLRVRVPATSANLGPGFDALGLALALHDEAEIEVSGRVLVVEPYADVPLDESNLVVRAFRAAVESVQAEQPAGLRVRYRSRIPHARGLGSSAAAICAGALAGLTWAGGDDSGRLQRALQVAADLEGHPDNVAACLFGGLTVAWREEGNGSNRPASTAAVRLEPASEIRAVVMIPQVRTSTEQSRVGLPAALPFGDAAYSVGRAALVVAALTTSTDALLAATADRLHQPYRLPMLPMTAELVRRLRDAGVPGVLSGSGPTVLALCRGDDEVAQALAVAESVSGSGSTGVSGALDAFALDLDLVGAHVLSGSGTEISDPGL